MDEKKALKVALETFSKVEMPQRKKIAKAFVGMMKQVDKDPESIQRRFNDDLPKEVRQHYRMLCAEIGMEILPDDVQVIIDLYQLAYSAWEQVKLGEENE